MSFNLNDHIAKLSESENLKLKKVQEEQLKLNMTPRNDSILTYNYAKGNVPDYLNDPLIVAKELVAVDFVYSKTNYGSLIEDVMREIADHVRSKYRLDWNTTWEIVRFYVPDMLKLYCMKERQLKIDG